MDPDESAPVDKIVVEEKSNTAPQVWEKIESVSPSKTSITINLDPNKILRYRVSAVSNVSGSGEAVLADQPANSTMDGEC